MSPAKRKQWENLSTVRFRTEDVEGAPEDTASGERVHIAIVYGADDTIQHLSQRTAIRKAVQAANRLAGRPAANIFAKTMRSIELTASKDLELEEARVYNVALTPEQIAESYRSGGRGVTAEDLIRAMNPEQQALRTRSAGRTGTDQSGIRRDQETRQSIRG